MGYSAVAIPDILSEAAANSSHHGNDTNTTSSPPLLPAIHASMEELSWFGMALADLIDWFQFKFIQLGCYHTLDRSIIMMTIYCTIISLSIVVVESTQLALVILKRCIPIPAYLLYSICSSVTYFYSFFEDDVSWTTISLTIVCWIDTDKVMTSHWVCKCSKKLSKATATFSTCNHFPLANFVTNTGNTLQIYALFVECCQ